MKKFLSVLLIMLVFCSCVPVYEKIEFTEGIHYPHPMTVKYGDISFKIPGAVSSWDFPGNEEYAPYAEEAVLEHPFENKDIVSFAAGTEKTAELFFSENIILYEVRRWKVKENYLEDEIAGRKLDDEIEKVKTEEGVFEVPDDGGIYVYEVYAKYEYGDCYYWFRIDPADEWGITFSLKEVTDTGAAAVFEQNGKKITGELIAGEHFYITDIYGEKIKQLSEKTEFIDLAYYIPIKGTLEIDTNWSPIYGKLEPGEYMIHKEVLLFRGTGDYDKKEYSAKFAVE